MPRKILIIETDQSLLSILKDSFQRASYSVITTGIGNKGVLLALNEHPDLILLDATSSDTAGIEILKNLKSTPAKNILLIFLGNQSRQEHETETNNLNSRIKFIDKSSITIEQLISTVFTAIKNGGTAKKVKAGKTTI